ncbi:hypothetical protein QT969_10995 [Rhodococcus sp. CSLK01-03]|uniref:Uncharacterized protein n=1 Tax=Rhodococcus indonesiensis TaxID=3055869 RepID=A0ABT7RND8_9NOCA|nr:hypothetical protein [Rhodococcus indonesiensis]
MGSGATTTQPEDPAKLDPATYQEISERDFALLVKDPDAFSGRKIVVYGRVTQFDSATGTDRFRADTAAVLQDSPYDYDENTAIEADDPALVADVVEDDIVKMYVEVDGSYSYDTQIGGRTTVPKFTVNIIELMPSDPASTSRMTIPVPPSTVSAPRTAAPLPTVPGADAQGFIGVPGGRCNYTNSAVLIGRTPQSLVVICETGVGRLYYKGVRLSDGAPIEIDDPVRTELGYVVTNEGVQYWIDRDALIITRADTRLAEEPMLQYWAR